MSTQRTGRVPPQNPPSPSVANTAPDVRTSLQAPTAQQAAQQAATPPVLQPGESMNIAGRDMTRISVLGAVNEHMTATGTDLFGNPTNENAEAAQFAADAAKLGMRVTAEPERQESGETVRRVSRQETENVIKPPPEDEQPEKILTTLTDQINMAHRAGNEELANELKQTLSKVLGTQQSLKKLRKQKKENPILGRLKADLGLQRIQPTMIEWAGFKWHFAAPPAAMDRWLLAMTANDGANMYSVLKVAISLVGIDDEPLWKVLSIDLDADYQQDGSETIIRVPLYNRLCTSCGNDVGFETDRCQQCGTLLDKFSVPLALRLRCADAVNQFFQNDFGPYEQLIDLYELLTAAMPDRIKNHNDIYPFLKVFQTPPETTVT